MTMLDVRAETTIRRDKVSAMILGLFSRASASNNNPILGMLLPAVEPLLTSMLRKMTDADATQLAETVRDASIMVLDDTVSVDTMLATLHGNGY